MSRGRWSLEDWQIKLSHELLRRTQEAVRINHIPWGRKEHWLGGQKQLRPSITSLFIDETQKVVVEWIKASRNRKGELAASKWREWVVAGRALKVWPELFVTLPLRLVVWHCLCHLVWLDFWCVCVFFCSVILSCFWGMERDLLLHHCSFLPPFPPLLLDSGFLLPMPYLFFRCLLLYWLALCISPCIHWCVYYLEFTGVFAWVSSSFDISTNRILMETISEAVGSK